MTAQEIRTQCTMLHAMESQFESVTGGVIMITAPGTDLKHVYSGALATKIGRAIARALEQERFRLINKRY